MEALEGRLPPYDDEAEVAVLGAMMLSKDALTIALELLEEDCFYRPAHGLIFRAMGNLYAANEPADLVTVADRLTKEQHLEEVGGASYLASLSAAVVTTSNVEHYANILRDKRTLRRLIETSNDLIDTCYRQEGEVGAIVERAEKAIFDITQNTQMGGLVALKDILYDSFSAIQERAKSLGGLTGLTTGFADLDRKLSGLQKSDLILLAARPSMGKTALMVNIATNAALRARASVAMFSLEMSRDQLVQRIISSNAHVDMQQLISGNLEDENWSRIIEAMEILRGVHIDIDDTPGITPLELKAKCRRIKEQKGLDLIVIDYLQLMQMGTRTESRQQEISAISRSLKAIAKELQVPVLALSQLSRAPELRTDHRPMLSDLRESGAIEQDADVVMLLYREDYYNEESDRKNLAELIVAKHRNGPTGSVDLGFRKEFTKFVDLTTQTPPM